MDKRTEAGRFFLWCAGSDRELLRTPAEVTKHAGLGTLVLVPAVLALFAMTYAVSTLTRSWLVTSLAGLAWALIVFCFDRYVVSTFRKSPSLGRDLLSPIFLTRLVLAGFIGIIVAHPLVLLTFNDSVEARLDAEQAAALRRIDNAHGPAIEAARAELHSLRSSLEAREQQRLDAQTILMQELGGVGSARTTGRYGRGIAAEAQEGLRDMTAEDLERFRAELPAREGKIRERLTSLEASLLGEKEAAPQGRDYIARARVLETLSAESTAISTVRRFLILFFVFVDTLPVLFKALTPRGPYDELLALQELRISVEVEGHREILLCPGAR